MGKQTLERASNERASDAAYQAIRKAIMAGIFPYGTKLRKRAMAEYCGMSIIPVIDALNRLESEGLVESNPYSGSRVVEPDPDKIADAFVMREAIEAQAVRILCYTIGLDDIVALRKEAVAVDSMAGKPHEGTEYDDLHYAFHLSLVRLTRSKNLLGAMEKIHLFSLLVQAEEEYSHQDEMISEYSHGDVVDCIAQRRPEEASKMIRQHIYRSPIVRRPLWVEL